MSEHTLLALRENVGWFATFGDPISALITLAPSVGDRGGLVEMAGDEASSINEAWAVKHDDVIEAARAMGMDHLEVIDRHGAVAGGEEVRAVVRMSSEDPVLGPTSGLERFVDSDIAGIVNVVRAAFRGHPENGDWTATDIEKRISEPWFDAEGLLLGKEGDVVAGFCWTKVHPDSVGEIYLIAVHPDNEGQGLGRKLVKAGLGHLKLERGCQEVIVYTEAANSAARRLYLSLGFEVDRVDRRIGFQL